VKKKLLNVLLNLDLAIACISMAALILFTFFAVIMRYIVTRPVSWGEEFQLACVVIAVFFGGSAGFRLGGHVAIDFLVDAMPKKIRSAFEKAVYVFSILILIYFMYNSAIYVRQMAATDRITNILHIPYAVIYAVFPIACVLMIINYTASVYRKITGKEEVST
jgi:TRAP-type C4-dicarboxylate transport system permease small subunit